MNEVLNILGYVCMGIVGLQFLVAGFFIFLAATSESSEEDLPGPGHYSFCVLTGERCIYADGENTTCKNCPQAEKHYFKKEEGKKT